MTIASAKFLSVLVRLRVLSSVALSHNKKIRTSSMEG